MCFCYAQQKPLLTNEQIVEIANKMKEMESEINNQKISIDYLEDLVKEYEEQTAIDSSLLSQKDLQISVLKEREDNYEQQIKLVKPKWYDNKYLWYTYGIASAIIPIYLASQIPGL
tara:strand:- start:2967 stop:3314 length:348 start_codon:yes stop_codon:yes gene_type:complete